MSTILLRRPDGSRVSDDALGVQVESAKLKAGDTVVVITKTGRTMAEGEVVDASSQHVTVRRTIDSVDQMRTYTTDLYSFMRKVEPKVEPALGEGVASDEARAEPPEVDQEDAGSDPITHSGTYDAASPAVEIVRGFISDRRLAYAFWIDMTSRGPDWAARRHHIGQDTVIDIVAALRNAGMLHPGIGHSAYVSAFSDEEPGSGEYHSGFEESATLAQARILIAAGEVTAAQQILRGGMVTLEATPQLYHMAASALVHLSESNGAAAALQALKEA